MKLIFGRTYFITQRFRVSRCTATKPASAHSQQAPASRRYSERFTDWLVARRLAWLLSRSPNNLLIPGTSNPAHPEENIAAGTLKLTEEDLALIG